MVKSIQITWSTEAQKDLKRIYRFCSKVDVSYANRVIDEIIESPKDIVYNNQFQQDEFIGSPYHRYFVEYWRIVYKSKNNQVSVLRVFDTRKDPKKLK